MTDPRPALPGWVRPLPIPTPFAVGAVNCWLVTRDPVTLIDAGPRTPEAAAALDAALREEGVPPDGIRRLLLTHGHHDHFGAAGWLAKKSRDLCVMGSPRDGHHFRKDRDLRTMGERLARSGLPRELRELIAGSVLAVDRFASPIEDLSPLADGELLGGDGWGLEVVGTPGHTPGSLSYRIRGDDDTDLLATGDTLLVRITPNAVVDLDPEDPTRIYSSVSAYVATLDRILALAPAGILTGHGRAIADLPAQHEYQASRRELRRKQILGHLAKTGPVPAATLMGRIFPEVDRLEMFLAFSEVVGYLLWLAERGEVTCETAGGLETWRAAAEPGENRPGIRR